MDQIAIRPAEPCDSEAVYVLAKAFATSFAPDRTAFESAFVALLGSSEARLSVAIHGEEVVGYLLGFDHLTFFANGRVSWLEEIMVSQEMRRKGVGRRLMQDFEQWAIARKSKLVALATRRAESFYRGLGYDSSAEYFRRLL